MFSAIAALSTCAIAIASGDSNTCDEGAMLQVTRSKVRKHISNETSVLGCSDYQTRGINDETGKFRCLPVPKTFGPNPSGLQRYNGFGAPRTRCPTSLTGREMQKVASVAECEALAVENCHGFFSFRFNPGNDGGHKCYSSDECAVSEDDYGTTTNSWGMFATPFSPALQALSYVGCFSQEGVETTAMATADDPGDTFVNCMSFCVCSGHRAMSLHNGGARCYCHAPRAATCANEGQGPCDPIAPPDATQVDDGQCEAQGQRCNSGNTHKCGGSAAHAFYRFT